MAKVCRITGKKPQVGHNVSHSMRHTKRRFMPNLVKKRMWNPEKQRFERVLVSVKGLRNLVKAK